MRASDTTKLIILLLLLPTASAQFGDEKDIFDDFHIQLYTTGVTFECLNNTDYLLPGDIVNITLVSPKTLLNERFVFEPGCEQRFYIDTEGLEIAMKRQESRMFTEWDGEENSIGLLPIIKESLDINNIGTLALFTIMLLSGIYLIIRKVRFGLVFIAFAVVGITVMLIVIFF